MNKVDFKLAKLANEKGFDYTSGPGIEAYNKTGDIGSILRSDDIYYIMRPTLSELKDWLREVKKVDISINVVYQGDQRIYSFEIQNRLIKHVQAEDYDNYQDALKDSLEIALKNFLYK